MKAKLNRIIFFVLFPTVFHVYSASSPVVNSLPKNQLNQVLTSTDPGITFGSSQPLLFSFGYVPAGNFGPSKTAKFLAQHISGILTVTAPTGFEMSKNNVNFSTTLSYSTIELNDSVTFYVRFKPVLPNEGYGGAIRFAATGINVTGPDVSGSSLPPEKSLDIVNWNLAWFGSTSNGPTDEDRQEFYASVIMDSLGADLYILQEIVDTSRLGHLARSLKNGPYNYLVAPYASSTSTNTNNTWRAAQKLAYIYRAPVFSNISSRGFTANSTNPNNYYNWASGRFPYLMEAVVTIDGIAKRVVFLNLHAKAESGLVSDYQRRQGAALLMYDSLNTVFPNQHVIIAGDYNDDLDVTISSAMAGSPTPYLSFVTDAARYSPISFWNTQRGDNSYIGYPNMIDHSIVSNEMQLDYVPFSNIILKDAQNWVPFYRNDLTDHYPMLSRFNLRQSAVNQVTATTLLPTEGAFVKVVGTASGQPILHFTKTNSGPVVLQCFTSTGLLVWQQYLNTVGAGQILHLPLHRFPKGLLLLKITSREGIFTTKLLHP